jgi:Ulp1 family protease
MMQKVFLLLHLFEIISVHYILHRTLLARDDPESIEICYADIDCLAPEGFLTSTIMNFYIRLVYRLLR